MANTTLTSGTLYATMIVGGYMDREVTYKVYTNGSTLYVEIYQQIAFDTASALWSIVYNGTTKTGTTNSSTRTITLSFTYSRSINSFSISFTNPSNSSASCYFDDERDITSKSISWTALNNKPTATITVPELKAGKTARISWTTSDSDGDTVKTRKIVRYYKSSTATKYTSTTLYDNSSGMTTKYYDDTIPEDAVDGSIYYVLTIYDGYTTATITSETVTVIAGSSFAGNQNFGGAWEEMDSVWECYNGVWTEIAEGYECINGVWQETN